MDTKKLVEQAKKIIEDNIYLTVASSSKKGKPWISPLFFSYDKDYNFYWVSGKNALHSKLIRENPEVAITIFDSRVPEGKGDGVYFRAKVKELSNDKEIIKAIQILNKRVKKDEFKIKTKNWVKGKGLWRVYKAICVKTYKLTEGKFINGQYIDERVEIKLT